MYEVDDRDRVRELVELPQSSTGAPLPVIVSDESRTAVAFYLQDQSPWDGRSIRVMTAESAEPWAVVVFDRCYAHIFGPPNDEAFAGHPLAGRGLYPYGAFVVESSSWLRRLERMNSVHRGHDRQRFLDGRYHFILSFHDSTFECIAGGYAVVQGQGPLRSAVTAMQSLLHADGLAFVQPPEPR